MTTVRTAARLLAWVLVLGFAREAAAEGFSVTPRIIITEEPVYDLTIRVFGQRFGFEEEEDLLSSPSRDATTLYAGPFGSCEVPFTATHSLVGFCVMLAMLAVLPAVCWRRKRGGA